MTWVKKLKLKTVTNVVPSTQKGQGKYLAEVKKQEALSIDTPISTSLA
jgi:hypothetical protein